MMIILPGTIADIDVIFQLFEEGTAYQKKVSDKHWQGFERSLVETDIAEGRQWKIIIAGEIAAVFAITFNDPFIWQEKDADPAIYIHRIATHPTFRGRHLVKHIVEWAKGYAAEKDKRFIRMDTGAGNDKLNNYYVSCGFTYLGITQYPETDQLPAHYRDGSSSLFEIQIPS